MLRRLILKYYDEVFRYCCYKTGDEQAAYDCTQDTFLHLIRYIGTYIDKRKFKAYLFTIARNACYDYFRGNAAAARLVSLQEFEKAGVKEKENDHKEWDGREAVVEDEAIRNTETRQMLNKALDSLPDFQREVLVLRFMYDFKLKEIAGMTGVPLTTVKSRLQQGLNKLKKILEGA